MPQFQSGRSVVKSDQYSTPNSRAGDREFKFISSWFQVWFLSFPPPPHPPPSSPRPPPTASFFFFFSLSFSSAAVTPSSIVLLNVLWCRLMYQGQAETNAEAWFSIALHPRKPYGSLGQTAQDGHLDSHTAPELCTIIKNPQPYFWMEATLTVRAGSVIFGNTRFPFSSSLMSTEVEWTANGRLYLMGLRTNFLRMRDTRNILFPDDSIFGVDSSPTK